MKKISDIRTESRDKCESRKVLYKGRKKALTTANILTAAENQKMYAYNCTLCRYWHITSRAPRELQEKENKAPPYEQYLSTVSQSPNK